MAINGNTLFRATTKIHNGGKRLASWQEFDTSACLPLYFYKRKSVTALRSAFLIKSRPSIKEADQYVCILGNKFKSLFPTNTRIPAGISGYFPILFLPATTSIQYNTIVMLLAVRCTVDITLSSRNYRTQK